VKRTIVFRAGVWALALLAFGFLGSCTTGAARRAPSSAALKERLARGEVDRHEVTATASSLEGAAAANRIPRQRAAKYLEAARSYLACEEPERALQCIYAARKSCYEGRLAVETDALLGEAYLESGSASLAKRYLQKALGELKGEERELALARLLVCARAECDDRSADYYNSKLASPRSAAVEKVLSDGFPLAAAVEPPRSTPPRQAPAARPPAAAQGEVAPSSPGGLPRLVVLPRWNWRARPALANLEPMGRIDKITIHHSGGPAFWGQTQAETADEIRKIQNYHQTRRGWADIGYHYIIDRVGNVWQGRRLSHQGAHARGAANRGNIGIVLLGDYTRQSLTAAQRESVTLLLARLSTHFAIPPQRIYTHHEIVHGLTDCPGPEITRHVAAVREFLSQRPVAAAFTSP
jgi:hypothetical protein